MKRLPLILLILANSVLLFAQSSISNLYKQWMIEDINKGCFEKAAEEMLHVEDWTFVDKKNSWINVDNAFNFISYLDSMSIEKAYRDKFRLYIAHELDHLYDRNNDYISSISYLEKSLEIKRDVIGVENVDYVVTLHYIGTLCFLANLYDQAISYYRTELEIIMPLLRLYDEAFEVYGLRDNFNTLLQQVYGYLADSYSAKWNFDMAAYYYLQYLDLSKKMFGDQSNEYIRSLVSVGNCYIFKENYEVAEEYVTKALDVYQTSRLENDTTLKSILYALGNIYSEEGNFDKAKDLYTRSIELCKDDLNQYMHICLLDALGWSYYKMKDYNSAILYGGKAVDIILRESAEIKYANAAIYRRLLLHACNNIGIYYVENNDYENAEKIFNSFNDSIYRDIYGLDHIEHLNLISNIGWFKLITGNYDEAERYLNYGVNKYKELLGENHVYYLFSLKNLGRLYGEKGDVKRALNYYDLAYEKIKHKYMVSIDYMSENQRSRYLTTLMDDFHSVIHKFVYISDINYYRKSCFLYEDELFFKGLLLNSSEAVKRSIYESNDTTLISQWQELTSEKQIITTIQEKDPQSPYIAEHQERAEQLEKEITKSSAAYRKNQAMWQITWDSVRNRLSSNQIAIEYMVAPLNDDSTMYCALLLRDTCSYPIMIPLFEEKEVQPLANAKTKGEFAPDKVYDYAANGKELTAKIWSKIMPYIKPGETVYFAPSGLLHQLAIEALPYDSTHTMADVYNMVRLSSTREIVMHKNDHHYTTATLYGGIQYDVNADTLLAESRRYAQDELLASRGIEDDTLDRGDIKYLAWTKTEVEDINNLLQKNKLKVKLYTATSANEESFKALSGKHQNILHIATHGFFWTDSTAQKKDYFTQRMMPFGNDRPAPPSIDPLNRCGLLFAGAQTAWSGHSADLTEGVQDGILTAKEISLLDLRDADLVVLSACETGKGEITSDGVFGLQRAFKQAGAQTIIMSLWPVNDESTQLLMTEFYRNWITYHQSKREAFRNAQNTVRSKYEEPYYWAGFIMLD
jgi:CHAT domain-containing protein